MNIPFLTSQSRRRALETVAVLRDVIVMYDHCPPFALHNVSLEVRRGEVLGLLGPTGAGKSTVLHLLAGRVKPTEGRVKVLGRSPRAAATRARIGFLPAAHGPKHPRRGLWAWGKKWLGRTDGAKQPPRPNLAQVLVKKPELLMLDEPFAGLESARRRELTEFIRSLAQQGRTVIFSSDSLLDALTVCDRVALCHGGTIEFIGPLDELLVANHLRVLAPVLSDELKGLLMRQVREQLGEASAARGAAAKQRENLSTASAPTVAAASNTERVLARVVRTAGAAPRSTHTTTN